MREVEADRRARAGRSSKQEISRATREIQYAIGRRQPRPVDEPPLPPPVLSIGEKARDEVVAIRDGRKEPPNVPLFAFGCGDRRSERHPSTAPGAFCARSSSTGIFTRC